MKQSTALILTHDQIIAKANHGTLHEDEDDENSSQKPLLPHQQQQRECDWLSLFTQAKDKLNETIFPNDVLDLILSYLPFTNVMGVCLRVCKQWLSVVIQSEYIHHCSLSLRAFSLSTSLHVASSPFMKNLKKYSIETKKRVQGRKG